MVQRWNAVVNDDDIVYHLGDVYFGRGYEVLDRLKGRKRLLLGNHDNGKCQKLQKYFQKIGMWRMFPEYNCLLTHVPVHESGLYKVHWNLHGHIHQNASPTPRHINCSVEVQDYMPKLITDLVPKTPVENG
jgi:calcineurin-like phosphoesterase family protein